MVSLKEYAESKDVSYESIRKQVAKYKDTELQGHIVTDKNNRGKLYLDDEGVQILDKLRIDSKTQVVVVKQTEKDKEIELLREKLEQAQAELLKSKDVIIKMQQEHVNILELQAQNTLLLERSTNNERENNELRRKLADTKAENTRVQSELASTQEELEKEKASYSKTIFGLYKKID